jgi:uncharacterized protein (TIGR01777 family)
VLVRRQSKHKQQEISGSKISYANWDIETGGIDTDAIAKADYIIHLAGTNVTEKRWTAKRKKEIIESRTKSSTLLIKAMNETPNKIKALISASAIGWYGPDTKESLQKGFKEDAPASNDFLGETCKQWEAGIQPITKMNKRLAIFRFGIVLSKTGGALKEFKKPLKFGIAAILGSGKQITSWIHIDDLCRLLLFAIENERISGVYNAVAPKPVSNKELTLTLAKKMRNKYFIPVHVPAFALKLILGEMSVEVLKSARVSNEKIRKTGFTFLYPSVEAALENLI